MPKARRSKKRYREVRLTKDQKRLRELYFALQNTRVEERKEKIQEQIRMIINKHAAKRIKGGATIWNGTNWVPDPKQGEEIMLGLNKVKGDVENSRKFVVPGSTSTKEDEQAFLNAFPDYQEYQAQKPNLSKHVIELQDMHYKSVLGRYYWPMRSTRGLPLNAEDAKSKKEIDDFMYDHRIKADPLLTQIIGAIGKAAVEVPQSKLWGLATQLVGGIPGIGDALSLAFSGATLISQLSFGAQGEALEEQNQEGMEYPDNDENNAEYAEDIYPANTLDYVDRPEIMLGQSTETMGGAGIMERKLPAESRVNNRSRRGVVAERMPIRDHRVMANALAITHGTPLDPNDIDAIPNVKEGRKKVISKAAGLRVPRKIGKKGGTTYTSLKNTLITPDARL